MSANLDCLYVRSFDPLKYFTEILYTIQYKRYNENHNVHWNESLDNLHAFLFIEFWNHGLHINLFIWQFWKILRRRDSTSNKRNFFRLKLYILKPSAYKIKHLIKADFDSKKIYQLKKYPEIIWFQLTQDWVNQNQEFYIATQNHPQSQY